MASKWLRFPGVVTYIVRRLNARTGGFDFQRIAREEVIREGFTPDFPPQVKAEAEAFRPAPGTEHCKDLRSLLWSSIDNVESRDLDQVEWAERLPNEDIRVLVGIADVDSMVKPDSLTDAFARNNGTSVYTGGPVFPMLPLHLSNGLTSLQQDCDRPAVIMEFVVASNGGVKCAEVCTAMLRNWAQLNYDRVGKWLRREAGSPSENPAGPELCEQLRLQEEASRRLKDFRKENGALTIGGVERVPLIVDNQVKDVTILPENPARDIIESFMIAANVAMASFLRGRNSLCIRRVVRTPKRWDRIQAIAAEFGTRLPDKPDPRPLNEFLAGRRETDPDRFPELSLSVLKALGPGEYIVEHPGAEREGHFGLAVNDYTHSTAPNRRYADLAMQRLLKAVVAGAAPPMTEAELTQLADHCTERETAARHVERFMKKVAAAAMLSSRIGQRFDAIVTSASDKGVYARLLNVPAEGRVNRGEKGLDVGQRIRVRLISVEPERGFIDLAAGG